MEICLKCDFKHIFLLCLNSVFLCLSYCTSLVDVLVLLFSCMVLFINLHYDSRSGVLDGSKPFQSSISSGSINTWSKTHHNHLVKTATATVEGCTEWVI